MSQSEYPTRASVGIVTTGDPDKDAEIVDEFLIHEKRMIEGICPNGCAELVRDDAHSRHCPQCGFHGWSNVPWDAV